jgi:formate dehydrogenase major subunit
MEDSDCIVVMGSNMAENHPVAFRWPMKAKVEHGAKIIHIDPRFTRTSAVADIYAPLRAGSDIAFLGGVIHYVLNSERWNTDPFFREWALSYTNAATLITEEFRDTEDADGVFSGLMEYKGGLPEWPFNGFSHEYEGETWQYARTQIGDQGRVANTAQSGETSSTKSGNKAPPPRHRARTAVRRTMTSCAVWSNRRPRTTRRSRTRGACCKS